MSSLNRTESLEGLSIANSPYRLTGHAFAAGSFGQIYLAQNSETGETVATKLIPKSHTGRLKIEYDWYCKLGPGPGLPKIYFFGECHPYDGMVMELLGPNLDVVFDYCNRRFSVRTTTQLAIQILEIIQYIHSQKIVFCNVKPENFCLGRPNTPQANQIYLIGFIHAKLFESETQQHIAKSVAREDEESSGGFGTPRYMSLHAHKGKALSRRDDLESIGYMLLYFLRGRLPWQGLIHGTGLEKYERIYTIKKSIRLEELCHGMPSEYYHFMLYVRTLKFAQEPNYLYLITMFTRLLFRINMDQQESEGHLFDWDQPRLEVDQTSSSSSRKQVSFASEHEAISIHSDVYFPYMRNFDYGNFYQPEPVPLPPRVDRNHSNQSV